MPKQTWFKIWANIDGKRLRVRCCPSFVYTRLVYEHKSICTAFFASTVFNALAVWKLSYPSEPRIEAETQVHDILATPCFMPCFYFLYLPFSVNSRCCYKRSVLYAGSPLNCLGLKWHYCLRPSNFQNIWFTALALYKPHFIPPRMN